MSTFAERRPTRSEVRRLRLRGFLAALTPAVRSLRKIFCTAVLASIYLPGRCHAEPHEAQEEHLEPTIVYGRVTTRPGRLTFASVTLRDIPNGMKPLFSVRTGGRSASAMILFDGSIRRPRLARIESAAVVTSDIPGWPADASEPLGAGDLTGDGSDELIGYTKGRGWFAFELGEAADAVHQLEFAESEHGPQQVEVGDADCDSLPDLTFRTPDANVDLLVGTGAFRFKKVRGHGDVGEVLVGRIGTARCRRMLYHSFESRAKIFDVLEPSSIWAEFLVSDPLARAVSGDFNGDGFADILMHTPTSLNRWWVGYSNTRTALETVEPSVSIDVAPDGPLFVGDFTGDGLDDLITRSARGAEWVLSTAVGGIPVSGASIEIDSVRVTTSAADGTYRSPPISPGNHTIGITLNGREFVASKLPLSGSRSNERVDFLATDPVLDRPRIGQLERYGEKPSGPYVCFGYIPGGEDAKWGRAGLCPPGAAALGTTDFRRSIRTPEAIEANISCCLLPTADILTGPESWSAGECPLSSVVTGSNQWRRRNGNDPHMIRCTGINTERYQLGPVTTGRYWGLGQSVGFFETKAAYLDVPEAVANGLRCSRANSFDLDGCSGPHGTSLLVGKIAQSKMTTGCEGFLYRELQYRGRPGDPASGTPVSIVPPCTDVENIFEPTTGCRERNHSVAAARVNQNTAP